MTPSETPYDELQYARRLLAALYTERAADWMRNGDETVIDLLKRVDDLGVHALYRACGLGPWLRERERDDNGPRDEV